MKKTEKKSQHRRPRVALLVETSLASGREILAGIGRFLREEESWEIDHEPHHLTDAPPDWLARWKGDGIIARLQTPALAAAVASTGLPAVDVLGVAPHPRIPVLGVDDAAIAQMVAAHFLERGFRRLAYLGLADEGWSQRRGEAFQAAAVAAGLPCGRLEIRRGRYAERAAIERWVSGLAGPVGIMVCSDAPAHQVLEACRHAGRPVPEDVAVVGVDNDGPVCDVCDPPLSSVDVGHDRLGYAAAQLLAERMRGKPGREPAPPIRPLRLVVRQSSDLDAVADPEVAKAMRLMRLHACEGLTVDDVVRQAAASRSTLQRRFVDCLGHGMHDELVRVRIRRAKELMLCTDWSLAQIAARCGYDHPEYLGVVFRRLEGASPAAWRRRQRVK